MSEQINEQIKKTYQKYPIDWESIISLIKKGGDINLNINTRNGQSPLLVEFIKDKNTTPIMLDIFLSSGDISHEHLQQALNRSVSRKLPDMVRILLDYGANPNMIDDSQHVSLLYRASSDYETLKALLDNPRTDIWINYGDVFEGIEDNDNKKSIELLSRYQEERLTKLPHPPLGMSEHVICKIDKFTCKEIGGSDFMNSIRDMGENQIKYFSRVFPWQIMDCDKENDFFLIASHKTDEGTVLCGMMNVLDRKNKYHINFLATQSLKNRFVRGVGNILIKHLIEDAHQNDKKIIDLTSINSSSTRFYKKMGFECNDLDYCVYKL